MLYMCGTGLIKMIIWNQPVLHASNICNHTLGVKPSDVRARLGPEAGAQAWLE
jgi:hypothetical protein